MKWTCKIEQWHIRISFDHPIPDITILVEDAVKEYMYEVGHRYNQDQHNFIIDQPWTAIKAELTKREDGYYLSFKAYCHTNWKFHHIPYKIDLYSQQPIDV